MKYIYKIIHSPIKISIRCISLNHVPINDKEDQQELQRIPKIVSFHKIVHFNGKIKKFLQDGQIICIFILKIAKIIVSLCLTNEIYLTMKKKKRTVLFSFFLFLMSAILALYFIGIKIECYTLPHGAKIRIFQVGEGKKNHGTIIICPGGSYSSLTKWREGYLWIPFFLKQDYTVAILEYRMPNKNYNIPITDAKEALTHLRHHAQEYGMPNYKIGMMGFSAGGHLVSTLAVAEKQSDRPDFAILLYPVISMRKDLTHKWSHDNLLGENCPKYLEEKFSSYLHITEETPPVYLAVSKDDSMVNPNNTFIFYDKMIKMHRPTCLKVYKSGGHGWGASPSFRWHKEMEEDLRLWLAEEITKRND